ncbi:MFS transporter [Paenibacillus elgii]|uniref:MFS transporter n=1 Tax=Paenibacillus elgii TaxID=189691 RepID=UPI000FD8A4C3|nr:MFS transporter [Paenibacillus elgii]NEN81765.1 MFS transporter [Paenibacillus elgii]
MKSRIILYLIGFSAFVASLAQNLYSPLLVEVQEKLHTTQAMVNLTVTVFTVALAVMQLVFGPLSDRKGRKIVLLPAIAVYTLASLGCAYAASVDALLVFRLLQGIGAAAVPVVAAAVIGDVFEGKERAQGMATYQLMLGLSPAVGPWVGGMIGGRYGYGSAFLLLCAVSLILLAANAFLLPETRPKATAVRKGLDWSSFVRLARHPRAAALLTVGFVQFLVYFVFLVYIPIIAHHRYGYEPAQTGTLMLLMALCSMIGVKAGGWVQSRFSGESGYLWGCAANAATVLLFAFTAGLSLPVLTVAFCLFGLTMGLTMSMPATLLTEMFPDDRATAVGVYNFVRYLGMAAGPMLGSLLFVGESIPLLFGVSAALYLGGIAIGGRLTARRTGAASS